MKPQNTINLIQQQFSSLLQETVLGIYIHIPFCEKKCGYCDFYSITDQSSQENFTAALLKEIRFYAHNFKEKPLVNSIFIGGGTPSILETNYMYRITSALKENFTIASNSEWTIEANPGTVDSRKLISYKMQGINRISFGVQSFISEELAFLGRIHSAEEAEESIQLAKDIGFKNINLDLMCAFPGQTIPSFRRSLKKALSLDIPHLSCYTLIPEENTPFYEHYQNGELSFKDETQELEFYDFTSDYLARNNFIRYEVSNFHHHDGNPCKHNLKYWNLDPYLGFGPSAHSYLSPVRFSNPRNIELYIQQWKKNEPVIHYFETLKEQTEIFEFIFLKLRMVQGIPLEAFQQKFNRDFDKLYQNQIQKLMDKNFAEISDTHFRLTPQGFALADAIAAEF